MASRAVMYWRRMVVNKQNIGLNSGGVVTRSFVSSTTPKLAAATSSGKSGGVKKPKMVELYPLFGMLVVALLVGVHTAYQNVVRSPGTKLSKKKRESLSEIDDPDSYVYSSGKVINKSFLRKVGQIQHDDNPVMPNNPRTNPYTVSRDVETLKSIGITPRKN